MPFRRLYFVVMMVIFSSLLFSEELELTTPVEMSKKSKSVLTTFLLLDEQYVLESVKIEGLDSLTQEDVFRRYTLLSQRGAILKSKWIQQDLDSLYKTGLFSSVSVSYQKKDREIYLVFQVKENPVIKRIAFSGVTQFSESKLKELFLTKEGLILNLNDLNQDVETLERFYLDQGYDLFLVKQVVLEGSQFIIKVEEGIISTVTVSGLNKVNKFVVDREIYQNKGRVFNSYKVRRDRNRIVKLGYFSEVATPKLTAGSQMNSVSMEYRLKERKSNFFDLGLEQLRDDQGVASFFKLYYNHLFLYSDRVSLKSQLQYHNALKLRSYSLTYTQPWLLNRYSTSMTTSLWTVFHREPFFGETELKDTVRKGASLTFGFPILIDELMWSFTGKLERVSPQNGSLFSLYDTRSISTNVSYDDRLEIADRYEGQYVRLKYEKGGDMGVAKLGGVSFSRWSLNMARFFDVSKRTTFGARAYFGTFEKQDDGVKIFESEGFYLGGATTLRGYPELAFSGNRRILYNFEYRLRVGNDVHTVLFHDLGAVFEDTFSYNVTNYRSSSGIGFRYVTGLTPFRLDFSWGRDFMIHFGLGQMF